MRLFLLVIATLIWGMGFVGTRWTLVEYSATWSNSLRYIFAGLLSIPFIVYSNKIKEFKGPLICAIILFFALQLQTIGIGHTTLAKSGFLTVFYAVFTPILTFIFYKQRFRLGYWLLLLIAIIGIGLLCEFKLDNFNYGDVLTLGSALLFSLHILAVDKYAENLPAIEFNLHQCAYMGAVGLIYGLFLEGPPSLTPLLDFNSLLTLTPSPLLGFVVLSIFSSIIAFSFQVYAQQGVPPHVVSLAFLLESIFASIFGYLFFDERLSTLSMIGCALVLISVAFIPKMTNFEKHHELEDEIHIDEEIKALKEGL